MSAAALITAGVFLGWGAAWLFFRQQINVYLAKIGHLEDVVADKLPANTYRPIRLTKGRSMIIGFSVLIIGLMLAAIGTVILLSNLKAKSAIAMVAPAPTSPIQIPLVAAVVSPQASDSGGNATAITHAPIYSPDGPQQRALLSALIPLKDSLPRKITILRPRDSGAQNVARIYERIFSTAGFDAEQDQQAQTDANQTGRIMMGVADSKNPPHQAIELADAMRTLGYEMPFLSLPEKLQQHEFAIFVGMNPL